MSGYTCDRITVCSISKALTAVTRSHLLCVMTHTHKSSPRILQGVDPSVEEKNGMTSNAKT